MLAYLLKVGALGTLDSRVPTFLLDRWETVGNSGKQWRNLWPRCLRVAGGISVKICDFNGGFKTKSR